MAWFKGDPDPAYDVARENAEEWAEAQKEQDQNNVLNSYPAYVSNIAKRAHGHTTAEIIIDVDGRSFVLEWRTSLIEFEVKEGMRIMLDVMKTGPRKLKFRKIVPLKLNEEQIKKLEEIVKRFKPI